MQWTSVIRSSRHGLFCSAVVLRIQVYEYECPLWAVKSKLESPTVTPYSHKLCKYKADIRKKIHIYPAYIFDLRS